MTDEQQDGAFVAQGKTLGTLPKGFEAQRNSAAFWRKQVHSENSHNPFLLLEGFHQQDPTAAGAIEAVWGYLASGGAEYVISLTLEPTLRLRLHLESWHRNFGEVHVQVALDGSLRAQLDEASIGGSVRELLSPTWDDIHKAVLGDLAYDEDENDDEDEDEEG